MRLDEYTPRVIWFVLSFALGLCLTLLVVRSRHAHVHLSAGRDASGPQRIHAHETPRIGGVGIYVSCLLVLLGMRRWGDAIVADVGLMLLACSLPAVMLGTGEDMTNRIRPLWRMLAIAVSAGLAAVLLGAVIGRTDLWGFDWIASHWLGAVLLAVFVVCGVANAVNIVDGFNGLATMCVIIMLAAITYVALQVNDATVAILALTAVGAVLGFFLWNYPAGLIFLGDGGAYLLGFLVAELGILLIQRNPSVSPLFPLLLVIYPVFETLFSMYRRKFVRGHPVSMPDGVHLHSLIYRRVLRWAVGTQDAKALTRRNSMTAPYLWLLCSLAVVPSVLFWDNSRVLGGFILLFAVTYVVLYARIVRFKAPRWLVARR